MELERYKIDQDNQTKI